MASILGYKGEFAKVFKEQADDLLNGGYDLPKKPERDDRGEFPADLSAHPSDELGFLLGYFGRWEAYTRARASIAVQVMIISKEEQLEEQDEAIMPMDAVVLKMEAAGRCNARIEGRRQLYKYAEAEYKKMDGLSASYKIQKEAISREITRREIRDRLGAYREMGRAAPPDFS